MKMQLIRIMAIGCAAVSLIACEKAGIGGNEEPDTPGGEATGPVDGEMTDSRDGTVYRTVTIGDQTWLAQNLVYRPYEKQDNDISWDEPRWYVWVDYNLESPTEKELAEEALRQFGVFYNWHSVMNGESPEAGKRVRGVCPEGWHLPSLEECYRLIRNVVDSGLACDDGTEEMPSVAKALALDTQSWMLDPYEEGEPAESWPAIQWEKNNASGFSAPPAGFRACVVSETSPDAWMQLGYSAGWWTSETPDETGLIPVTRLYSNDPAMRFGVFNPGVGLPVRCLKD